MSVEKRLEYYDACNQGFTTTWENDSMNLSLVSSPPSNCKDPNTYLVPVTSEDNIVELKTMNCETFFMEGKQRVNWGTLHCQVEELFLEGWQAVFSENM